MLGSGSIPLLQWVALIQPKQAAFARLLTRQRQVDGDAGTKSHLAAPARSQRKIQLFDPLLDTCSHNPPPSP